LFVSSKDIISMKEVNKQVKFLASLIFNRFQSHNGVVSIALLTNMSLGWTWLLKKRKRQGVLQCFTDGIKFSITRRAMINTIYPILPSFDVAMFINFG